MLEVSRKDHWSSGIKQTVITLLTMNTQVEEFIKHGKINGEMRQATDREAGRTFICSADKWIVKMAKIVPKTPLRTQPNKKLTCLRSWKCKASKASSRYKLLGARTIKL